MLLPLKRLCFITTVLPMHSEGRVPKGCSLHPSAALPRSSLATLHLGRDWDGLFQRKAGLSSPPLGREAAITLPTLPGPCTSGWSYCV